MEDEKLISARNLVNVIRDDIYIDSRAFARVKQHIVDAPDVVKHGQWEYWAGSLPRCPVCGYEYTDYLECKNYCGNCGAKLNEGE